MQKNTKDILDEVLLKNEVSEDTTIPSSIERVTDNTSVKNNKKIIDETIKNINYYKDKDRETIVKRINELKNEWDIERILEANASIFMLIGLLLGKFVNKRWFCLSGAVGAFLFQHAVQGWCPPLPVLRKLGKRTPHEIYGEIIALKFLAGDFDTYLKH